jgi:hypothetical protein
VSELAISVDEYAGSRAREFPVPVDTWLTDEGGAGADIAAQWAQLLDQPRWRYLEPGPAGLAWALVLLHSPYLGTFGTSLIGAHLPTDHVALIGARAGDLALVQPTGEAVFWNNADLLHAASCMSADRVRLRLSWVEWQPCERIDLRVRAGGSWFEPARARFDTIHRKLLDGLLFDDRLEPAQAAAFLQQLRGREHRILREARHRVVAGLDRRALGELRRAGAHLDAAAYNFLVSGGKARRQRESALRRGRGPLVAALHAEECFGLPDPAPLVAAIDARSPAIDALSEHYDTTNSDIEALARAPLRLQRIEGGWHARAVVGMLELLPARLHPRTRAEWDVFVEGAAALNAFLEALAKPDDAAGEAFRDGALRSFLVDAGTTGWLEIARRFPEVFRTRQRVIADVPFRLEYCCEALGLSREQLQGVLCSAAVEELICWGRSWEPTLDELAGTYLRVFGEACGMPDFAWPPLSSDFDLYSIEVVPICSTAQLLEAAEWRGYYVVNELPPMLFHGQHWVWIKNAYGERLSLMEFSVLPNDAGELCVEMVWHRAGPGWESEVPVDCLRAAQEYMEQLQNLPNGHFRQLERMRQEYLGCRDKLEAAFTAADHEVLRQGLARTLPTRLWKQIRKLQAKG